MIEQSVKTTPLKSTFDRSQFLKVVARKLAPANRVYEKLQWLNVTSSRSASLKSVLGVKLQLLKTACLQFAPMNLAAGPMQLTNLAISRFPSLKSCATNVAAILENDSPAIRAHESCRRKSAIIKPSQFKVRIAEVLRHRCRCNSEK